MEIRDIQASTMRIHHLNPSFTHIIVTIIADHSGMHHACNLSLVFIQILSVVVHGCLRFVGQRFCIPVQKVPKSTYSLPTEDAEDFTLLLGKLGRGFSAEESQVLSQEGVNSGQAQMGESGTVFQQEVDSLLTSGENQSV